MKRCVECGVEKDTSNFYRNKKSVDGTLPRCKPCHKARIGTHWDRKGAQHKYDTSEHKKAKQRAERRGPGPSALINRLRQRCSALLRGVGPRSGTSDLLGADPVDVISYLNDNPYGYRYGDEGVHVDHKIPCAAFKKYGDITTHFWQRCMCDYRNLQLLSAKDNCRKGGSCDYEAFRSWYHEFRSITGLAPPS